MVKFKTDVSLTMVWRIMKIQAIFQAFLLIISTTIAQLSISTSSCQIIVLLSTVLNGLTLSPLPRWSKVNTWQLASFCPLSYWIPWPRESVLEKMEHVAEHEMGVGWQWPGSILLLNSNIGSKLTLSVKLYRQPGDDNRMLVCDLCDTGYHTYCLDPPMSTIPKTGWKCLVGYLNLFFWHWLWIRNSVSKKWLTLLVQHFWGGTL